MNELQQCVKAICNNCKSVIIIDDSNIFGEDISCPTCNNDIYVPLPELSNECDTETIEKEQCLIVAIDKDKLTDKFRLECPHCQKTIQPDKDTLDKDKLDNILECPSCNGIIQLSIINKITPTHSYDNIKPNSDTDKYQNIEGSNTFCQYCGASILPNTQKCEQCLITFDWQQGDNQQTDNQQTDNQQTDNQQTDNQQTDNQQTGNQQTEFSILVLTIACGFYWIFTFFAKEIYYKFIRFNIPIFLNYCLLIATLGGIIRVCSKKWPSYGKAITISGIIVSVVLIILYGNFDYYYSREESENGKINSKYIDTHHRWTNKHVYRHIQYTANLNNTKIDLYTMEGPMLGEGAPKPHGMWTRKSSSIYLKDEYEFYWYGEKISEGTWYLRNK